MAKKKIRKAAYDPQLDAEEMAILEDYEAGRVTRFPVPANYAEMAKNTLKKNKNISIRISGQTLLHLQLRAAREGLPYQTLIGSVLHKYAEGQLQEIR